MMGSCALLMGLTRALPAQTQPKVVVDAAAAQLAMSPDCKLLDLDSHRGMAFAHCQTEEQALQPFAEITAAPPVEENGQGIVELHKRILKREIIGK